MSETLQTMTAEELLELRSAAEKATPGPWQWRFYGNGCDPQLVTGRGGMLLIMDFVRRGMSGAQPRFAKRERSGSGRWTGGIMRKFTEWWADEKEIAPDATWIAVANPTTVIRLLNAYEGAQRELMAANRTMERLQESRKKDF